MNTHAKTKNAPAPVPAMVVAEYILWQRHSWGQPTTTLEVIKLVYLSHGWFLGIHGNPLIKEKVETWPYGPIIPVVYERFKSYRDNPIDIVPKANSSELNWLQEAVIDATLRAYREYDSWSLSAITHQPGTPWEKTYGQASVPVISNSLIQQHYARLYRQAHASSE